MKTFFAWISSSIFVLVLPLLAILLSILFRIDDPQPYRIVIENAFEKAPSIVDVMLSKESTDSVSGESTPDPEEEQALRAILEALPATDLKTQLEQETDTFAAWMASKTPGQALDLTISLASLKEQGIDVSTDLRFTTEEIPRPANPEPPPEGSQQPYVMSFPDLILYHQVFHSVRLAATIIFGVLIAALLLLIVLLSRPPAARAVQRLGLDLALAGAVALILTLAISLAPTSGPTPDSQADLIISFIQPVLLYLLAPIYIYGSVIFAVGICMLIYGFIHRKHLSYSQVTHAS